jgi:uncharacterized protein DUF3309
MKQYKGCGQLQEFFAATCDLSDRSDGSTIKNATTKQLFHERWMMRTILLIIVIILLIGALPAWPYSTGWGYWPGGGLLLLIVLILLLWRA